MALGGRTGDRESSDRRRESELAESYLERACQKVSTVESFRQITGLRDWKVPANGQSSFKKAGGGSCPRVVS